mmetsp:Transcript_11609/g.15444  ORF Transcript_11609/g.15444 Transcript_11609/m.15444 type:complete len:431 (-) Transcript_11609:205-1497(-)
MPFGRVVGVLMLSGKGQAFVQMEDVTQATALVQYYASVHAVVRGSVVFFQFSNRSELSTNHSSNAEKQNRVLLVSVSNLMYPITIDVLQRVFKKYGVILRIVTFSKGASLQALIEFDQTLSAVQAKTELEGQNIYAGCCTLSIQFSNLESVTVKFNNDKSRDFTNPHLPSGTNDSAGTELGGYPMGAFGAGYGNPSALQMGGMGQSMGYGQGGSNPMAMGMGMSAGPSVLIVSNLEENRVNPDAIFTLFGVYGDVVRVKILYNRKDTALVQFTNSLGAENAYQNLNGVSLFGKPLKVNFSKHQQVSLPKEPVSESDMLLTKDFSNSPLHRFKNPNSKHTSHLIHPVEMLHVHNLPVETTDEQLLSMFGQYGTVVAYKFFESNRRMALVQFTTVEEATHALVYLHGFKMTETSHIRVSFSKSKIHKAGEQA